MKIYYVWDENLILQCNRLPAVIGRASLVHDLIAAYELLDHVQVVRSVPAAYNELKDFHSEAYLDHLMTFTDVDDDYMSTAQDEDYGLGYDCPPVSNMFELVSTIAGGSLTAAKSLVLGVADVAINWCGGWHHAQKDAADGFCYVNDIVLAIETLRLKLPKVLYVDLDIHHGNGVQDAYESSKSVLTLSLHKFEPGFYPGSGGLDDIGSGAGKGYSCNVPFKAAYSDDTLNYMFEKVFETAWELFAPDAVVVQCGADALAHDPHGKGSLSIQGYCRCVRRILDKLKPTVLLGGGGYKHPNVARLWTSLTALVTGVTLDENIPEHANWPSYGPDYRLAVEPTLARDTNKNNYLEECLTIILGNLNKYLKTEPDDEPERKRKKTDAASTSTENQVEKTDAASTSTEYQVETTNAASTSTENQVETTDAASTSTENQVEKTDAVSTSTENQVENLQGKQKDCDNVPSSPNKLLKQLLSKPPGSSSKTNDNVDIYEFTDD